MPENIAKSSKHLLLNPMDRISEALFGIIMVLTVTCSFSIGGAGETEVRQMLTGALGCNLAWGIIDAVMYWMACFSAKGQDILALRAVQLATDPRQADHIIADAMPSQIASVISPAQFEEMRQKLNRLPAPPTRPRLSKDDWFGGVRVFLIVVLMTLPVGLPFIWIHEATRALRVSNAVAVFMLFVMGYAYGFYSGRPPWRMGILMVIVGSAMVGLTIALGG